MFRFFRHRLLPILLFVSAIFFAFPPADGSPVSHLPAPSEPDFPPPPPRLLAFTPEWITHTDFDESKIPSDAPAIAQWNRTTLPGESLTLTGIRLTLEPETLADCTVWILVNSQLAAAEIWHIDEHSLTISLPENLPTGMALLWVQNRSGASAPIPLNRSEPQWIGPLGNRATPGETKRVFGRNLLLPEVGAAARVVLLGKSDDSAHAVSLRNANPYMLEFGIPEDLAPGSYQLHTHNGSGGELGWSAPLPLEIGIIPPTKTRIELSSDTDDPTSELKKAIDSLSEHPGGGVVELGAGTFELSGTVIVKPGVHLEGAGKDETILKGAPLYLLAPPTSAALPDNDILLRDLSVLEGIQSVEGKLHDVRFERVHLGGNSKFNLAGNRVAVIDSRVPVIDGLGTDSWFFGNTVHPLNPATRHRWAHQAATYSGNALRVVFEHNRFRNEWPKNEDGTPGIQILDFQEQLPGWFVRMFLSGGRGFPDSLNHTYIAHNVGENIAGQTNGDGNVGEMILFHSRDGTWFGSVDSQQGLTMKVGNANLLDDDGKPMFIERYNREAGGPIEAHENSYVVIVHGSGLGQARKIDSFTHDSITVTEPWRIEPDATSRVVICSLYVQNIVYGNELNAFPRDYPLEYSKSQGISLFGNSWENVIDGNMTRRAFNAEVIHARPLSPSFWNEFRDGRAEEIYFSGAHIVFGTHRCTVFPGAVSLGNLFRHGKYEITGPWIPGRGGPMLRSELNNHNAALESPIPAHLGNVFEFMQASGGKIGIGSNKLSQTLFRNNLLELADDSAMADIPALRGISLEEGSDDLFFGNRFRNEEEAHRHFEHMHYAIQDTGHRGIRETPSSVKTPPRITPLHRVAWFPEEPHDANHAVEIPIANTGLSPLALRAQPLQEWITVSGPALEAPIPPQELRILRVQRDPAKTPAVAKDGLIRLMGGDTTRDAFLGVRSIVPSSGSN